MENNNDIIEFNFTDDPPQNYNLIREFFLKFVELTPASEKQRPIAEELKTFEFSKVQNGTKFERLESDIGNNKVSMQSFKVYLSRYAKSKPKTDIETRKTAAALFMAIFTEEMFANLSFSSSIKGQINVSETLGNGEIYRAMFRRRKTKDTKLHSSLMR